VYSKLVTKNILGECPAITPYMFLVLNHFSRPREFKVAMAIVKSILRKTQNGPDPLSIPPLQAI